MYMKVIFINRTDCIIFTPIFMRIVLQEERKSNVCQTNAIYGECVCRGTPSIGIITNDDLI